MEDDNVDLDELIAQKGKRRKRMSKLLGDSASPGEDKRGRRRRQDSGSEDLGKKRGRPKKGDMEVTFNASYF